MDAVAFQDAMGETLLSVYHRVPEGILVFFPSYGLLDKLSARWKSSGLWEKMHACKQIFVEPRQADEFSELMKQYRFVVCMKSFAQFSDLIFMRRCTS